VIGHFGKYDVASDRIINIAEGVFLTVDRIDDGPNAYIVNVLD